MTDIVNIYDAKTNLSKLVDRAAAGEEIVIAKAGKPVSR
jgi:prevent-host-death family protein